MFTSYAKSLTSPSDVHNSVHHKYGVLHLTAITDLESVMVPLDLRLDELEGRVRHLQPKPMHATGLLYHVDDVGMEVDLELMLRALEDWHQQALDP